MYLIKRINPTPFRFLMILWTCSMLFSLYSCESKQTESKTITPAIQPVEGYNPMKDKKLTVDVFKIDSIEYNGSRGWGYDIMIDGKPYIHQPNIPAIMGNSGFSSEEKARQTGEFIIKKIKNNILPPSITPEELDSLGVLN